MPNTPPETLTLDRVATPVGGVLLVTDAEGAVRALDFADYEPRMMRLLGRHSPGFALIAGRAPETVRRAVERLAAMASWRRRSGRRKRCAPPVSPMARTPSQ